MGRRTEYIYDIYGNLEKTIYPDGTEEKFTYDKEGNRLTYTDRAGNVTKYFYDKLGRLVKKVNPDGSFTETEYDVNGRKIKEIDALGNVTTYEYDKAGNNISVTDALGNTTFYEYDGNGNITKIIDARGNEINYEYDETGARTKSINAEGNTPLGQRATVTDNRGTTKFEYDVMGRLIKETGPDGISIEYTYDAAGNKTGVKVPSGTTTYTYDKLNRLSTVTDPDGGVTTYIYDEVGNRTGVTYPNGTKMLYTYDELNRLVELVNQDANGEIISSYKYTLGPAGSRIKIEEHTGRVIEYEYDNTYKLLKETINNPDGTIREISYTYDAVGNRLTKTDDGNTVNYTYDENNRLISEGENVYTYDNNGNTLSKKNETETILYTYGYDNRLVSVVTTNQTGTSTVEYVYDVDGIRVGKIVDDAKFSRYTVDKNTDYAKVLEERNEKGKLIVSYVHGDDLISQKRGDVKSYYHFDGLGSTRALTNSNGEVTDTYTYDAFGNLIEKTGDTENEFLYTGEQYDANIGFYYLRARYMNPAIGRFTTMDPFEGFIQDPYSLHKYLYAHANPVMNIDPSGNFTLVSSLLGKSLAVSISLNTIFTTINVFYQGIFNDIYYTPKQLIKDYSIDVITGAVGGLASHFIGVGFVNGKGLSFGGRIIQGMISGGASSFLVALTDEMLRGNAYDAFLEWAITGETIEVGKMGNRIVYATFSGVFFGAIFTIVDEAHTTRVFDVENVYTKTIKERSSKTPYDSAAGVTAVVTSRSFAEVLIERFKESVEEWFGWSFD
ncbi:tRNA3(Ser)-specific nuclease WapA precursor [Acetivibrio saccincola]|uniref:tRNA3(Ser)-specific nuclease WapA n=1 Tax=Acetivibrio saccincola TaxID=1677857 RepID=A0A2K9EI02_9FIRM|nr:tRNA3(Ser)-specific nuclease WapA precursor [Acetivibrio saccincola]AUG58855.1 tRNA3(Ser)-specific nuclease WapA precursor [Acetivibrio saccincola]